jgi:hypothetical protein
MKTLADIPAPEDFDDKGVLIASSSGGETPSELKEQAKDSDPIAEPSEDETQNSDDSSKETPVELHELHDLHVAQVAQEPSGSFPIEVLPEPMRGFVEGIANSRQLPIALPAVCALGVLSTGIGKGLRLQGGLPDMSTPANLYLLVGAASGTGKSSAIVRIANALYNFEESHKIRIVCEDATNEALIKVLFQNKECMMSLSSDARDATENLAGRYRDGGKTDEGVFLKGFSWEPHTVDRVTREPLRLRRPCLTILWLVQPDKIDLLFGKASLKEGGLLPRFLSCQVNAVPQKLDWSREELPKELQEAWNESIDGVLTSYRSLEDPEFVQIDKQARLVLADYHEKARQLQLGELSDYSEFIARYHEQALRLALVMHVGEHGGEAHLVPLSLSTARGAIKLHEWFSKCQLEILAQSETKSGRDMANQILKLIDEKTGGISKTDVYRKRIVKTADQATKILDAMVESGLIEVKETTPKGGGHTVLRYLRKQ